MTILLNRGREARNWPMRVFPVLLIACAADAQIAVTMQNLPDTGQVRHFAEGDDADYNIRPPSLAANDDGTVMDLVTGLQWQQSDGGEMKWESAEGYCAALELGGYEDWRVPANRELFTIMNHNNAPPAIDVKVFLRSPAEYWWSSDLLVGDPSRAWAVNAGGGTGPHPVIETVSAGGGKRFHTRCVRQGLETWAVGALFTTNGDGTVTDNRTGLMWQEGEPEEAMSWNGALDYALQLDFAGYTDWRLPNIKELQSLHDESAVRPSIALMYFPSAKAGLYWSSTTQISPQADRAWTLDSTLGIVSYNPKADRLRVRLVRGGNEDRVQEK